MKRDGALTSAWQQTEINYTADRFSALDEYDVVIAGGGITGLTTALLLQQAGKKCLVAEAATAGFGTTSGTSAHLNTSLDTPYQQMMDDFGEDNARLIAQGAKKAIELIRHNVELYNIACALEEKDAYLFSVEEKQNKDLETIVDSANKVGVLMEFVRESPYPIPFFKVAKVKGQGQINPTQYLFGLIKAFQQAGGKLLENCRVTAIKGENLLEITTSLGVIRARHAIYATHIPPGINLLHFRCAPYRSYVIAAKLKNNKYPDELGYDMAEPYHYYRTHEIEGQKYLLAGGEDHKTGHEDNTTACFTNLEDYVKRYFPVEEISFRWSSQYFEPTDGLPYIGHLPGSPPNVYVATGYGGNGLIYGTLAATILCDLITTSESDYKKLLDPGRVKPVAGFSNFIKEGADVTKQLITGLLPAEKLKELDELEPDSARVVKFDGAVMGIYKDALGNTYAVNSTCPHIKCTVQWNNAEKSWDCPCHGSRFSFDGELLTAPAVQGLERIDLTANANQ